MTIIPEDTEFNDRNREIGLRAETSTRRVVAAIAGALEGLVEALDEFDLAEEGKQAIHEAGELSRSTAGELRTQAQTPEMQKLGEQAKAAGSATAGAFGTASGRVVDAKDRVVERASEVRENVSTAAHERVESVKFAAQRAREEVKVRTDAVKETSRRARVAPGRIRHELMEAWSSWKKGLVTSLAMFGVLALLGITAFIVLTIALVVGLNNLVGDPLGTFLVALLYVVGAGIAYAVARSARKRAAHETEERMTNAREELRSVGRPVRNAFSRGRSGI